MDVDNLKSFSIEELASLTGFDRRVIRSFIEQGLLLGPDKMGRYAQYSSLHLNRLLAIKFFREKEGMTTGSIRSKLLTMSPKELDVVAKDALADKDSKAQSSALDYLKSIGTGFQKPESDRSHLLNCDLQLDKNSKDNDENSKEKKVEYKNAFELLQDELSKLIGNKLIRKQAKSERWYRISITPDVEISVRGIEDEEQITSIERIGDYLREILMGGHDNG